MRVSRIQIAKSPSPNHVTSSMSETKTQPWSASSVFADKCVCPIFFVARACVPSEYPRACVPSEYPCPVFLLRSCGYLTMSEVLIVGGGIGGLTAALCLAQQGQTVQVLEQAPAISEAGAGIQLSPNATRVLFHLGLQGPLTAAAYLPQRTEIRDWRSGRVISSNVLGEAVREQYGFPYLHVHRSDLVDVLERAVRSESRITLHVGMRVDTIHQDANAVSLAASDKSFDADILIGADGIRSVVRESLFGPERATFTGNVAWRMLIPVEDLPAGLLPPVAGVWWGPGRHFVHYFVRRGELVNCVCVVEQDGWTVESWTEPGNPAELRRAFAGWHSTIQTLIDAAKPDSLFKWALFDRPPMPEWSRGRTTLLGDACHPTLPFMAQGAAMAIEDAAVLAACVAGGGGRDVITNLDRYAQLRRARTAGIQLGSRRNATIFHLSGIKAWLRNRAAGRAASGRLDGIFRYDALRAHE